MKKTRGIPLALLACLVLLSILASCSSTGTNTYSAYADIPGYLTKNQKAMIKSLSRLDSTGHLYELNYTQDYQLSGVVDMASGEAGVAITTYIRSLMSPNSRYKTPVIGYGSSCSAFFANAVNRDAILASNHDGANVDGAAVILHTSPVGGYRSVGLVDMGYMGITRATFFTARGQDMLLDTPFYTVSGMNEKGFAVASLDVTGASAQFEDTDLPNLPSFLVVRYLLDNVDSIDAAVDVLNGFDIVPDADGAVRHFIVADESGDAAVIEFVDGRISLIKAREEGGSLSVTNHFLTPGESEVRDGLWRKRMIDMGLAMNSSLSADNAMDILSSVRYSADYEKILESREEGRNPYDLANVGKITVWSVVYNVSRRSATLAMRENFANIYNFTI